MGRLKHEAVVVRAVRERAEESGHREASGALQRREHGRLATADLRETRREHLERHARPRAARRVAREPQVLGLDDARERPVRDEGREPVAAAREKKSKIKHSIKYRTSESSSCVGTFASRWGRRRPPLKVGLREACGAPPKKRSPIVARTVGGGALRSERE